MMKFWLILPSLTLLLLSVVPISNSNAQTGLCFGGPQFPITMAPDNVIDAAPLVALGKFTSQIATNSVGGILARRREDGDASYTGGDISNLATPGSGCFTAVGFSNVPRIAGPPFTTQPQIINATQMKFVLFADEPTDGSSILESLTLKFYSNGGCGLANLVPFMTINIPANCSLTPGYYVFGLSEEQANALQPHLSAANSSSSSNASAVYVGASISVSRDDAVATPATAGEVLYVSRDRAFENCNFTLAPTSQTFEASGGFGTVNITDAGGNRCFWAGVSSVPWITMVFGNGSGSGALSYMVQANDSGSPRAATITVAGQVFTITQSCNQISPQNAVFDEQGGSASISIGATGASCNWTATTSDNWIHINAGGSGAPPGQINYTVDPNTQPGSSGRIGALDISGFRFEVKQAGNGGNCGVTPTTLGATVNGTLNSGDCPSSLDTNKVADQYTFTALAGQHIAFETSAQTFVQINLIAPDGRVLVSGLNRFSRTLPFSGEYRVEVTASIFSLPTSYSVMLCAYSFSASNLNFGYAGGIGTISVTAQGNCNWTAVSTAPAWLSVLTGPSYSSSATVNFLVSGNSSANSRSVQLTIAGRTFIVHQAGSPCQVQLISNSQCFSSSGGGGTINVTEGDPGCSWAVSSSDSWLQVTSGSAGSGNGIVSYTVQPNTGPARSGRVNISGRDFTVRQLGAVVAPGDLDATFGDCGKVMTDFAGGLDRATSLAIQPDGKIVVAGRSNDDFAVIRYNSDGSLDTAFGTGGKVTTDFSGGPDFANGIALQPDGKIIAAGGAVISGPKLALARYNSDGSLDTAFGTGGKVTTDFLSGLDLANGIALQPDGKIVVAGRSAIDFLVVRYESNGSLDTSFGTGGWVRTPGGGPASAYAIALQPDGQIVIGGTVGSFSGGSITFKLLRYDSIGTRDLTFDGTTFFPQSRQPAQANALALQPDGKIIAAGLANGADFALVRYTTGGSSDLSFGAFSQVISDFTGRSDEAKGLALQPDGKIIVAGIATNFSSSSDFALVRCNSNGTLDNSFGSFGRLVTDFSSASSGANAIKLQADGKIIVAGFAGNDFALARYESGCSYQVSPLTTSFPASGGNGSVSITAAGVCGWSATSNAEWITITNGSGSATGSVSYTVAANPTTSPRSATITIAGQTYTVYQGVQFSDVPLSHPFYTEIGKLSARGITLGCGSGNYCPDASVTREQMAAFIIRSKGEFNPPLPASQRFNDVPPANLFYSFIDRMAVLQITLGCSASPPLYCPGSPVTREQMAAFIIRTLHEPGYVPPPPASQRFNDVPPSNPFYAYIEEMAVRGVTLGCSANPPLYCPGQSVTRAQMAAFLVRAFGW